MNRELYTEAHTILSRIDTLQRSADIFGNRLQVHFVGINEDTLASEVSEFRSLAEKAWEEFLNTKIQSYYETLDTL
jgi:hypothetical protein